MWFIKSQISAIVLLGASVNICSAWQENHKNVKNAINVDIKVMAATAGGSFFITATIN